MQCEQVKNEFADYIAGRLDAEATKTVLEHLTTCTGCSAEADGLELLWLELETVPAEQPDADNMDRRFTQMLESYERGVRIASAGPRRRLLQALLAMMVLALGVYGAQKTGLLPVVVVQAPQAPVPSPQAPLRPNAVPQVAALDGVVVRLGSQAPIANARVVLSFVESDEEPPFGARGQRGQLTLPQPSRPPLTVKTDSRGAFRLTNIQPGQYRLHVSRDGYLRMEYGRKGNDQERPGTPIQLSAGQNVQNIRIVLTPTAAVAGHVFDKDREPLASVLVTALMESHGANGKRSLVSVQTARSNDLGEYRLYWLEPGQYVVTAMPMARVFADSQQPGAVVVDLGPSFDRQGTVYSARDAAGMGYVTQEETGETYIPVYFSGTTDPLVATRLDLQPGTSVTGIDLTVIEARAARLRGRVTSSLTGQAATGVTVLLLSSAETAPLRTATVTQTGAFEFRGVAPGKYTLIASIGGETVIVNPNGGFGVRPNANPNVERLAAFRQIEVGSDDLEDIPLILDPGYEIKGRISIEGQPTNDNDPVWQRTQVVLDNEQRLPGLLAVRTPVLPDGTFNLKGVMPGAYRLRVESGPPNTYTKSAYLGGVEALFSTIKIDSEPKASLEIVRAEGLAAVDVNVTAVPQSDAANVTVVLVPDAPRRPSPYMYVQGDTDADGKVHFDRVVPGEYKIFVWDSVPTSAWMDAEFISKYESLTTTIRVESAGKHEFQATILPPR